MTRGGWLIAAWLLLSGSVAGAQSDGSDDWALTRSPAAMGRAREEDASARGGLGQVERAIGRGDRAALEVAIARHLASVPDRALAETTLARVLAGHDLVQEALPHAERACALAPKSRDARRTLGQLLERARRLEEASTAWELVLRLSERASEARDARQHLVSVWSRLGVLEERAAVLERRVADDPADVGAAWLLIEARTREPAQQGRALALLEQLAGAQVEDVDMLRTLASLQARAGRAAEALATFERLIERRTADCDDAAAALELASGRAEVDVARRIAVRAQARCASDARVQRLIGALFRRRGERALARVAEERALALEPGDWETRLVRADDALLRGAPDEASDVLRDAVRTARDEAGVVAAAARLRMLAPRVLESALVGRTRDARVQRVAVGLLMEMHAERALQGGERGASALRREVPASVLAMALASEQARVRAVALDLLEARPSERLGPALLALLARRDAPIDERVRALRVLGALRAPAVGRRLRGMDVPTSLRPALVWAVASCEGSAAEGLLRSAAARRDDDVAVVAIVELARLGRLSAVPGDVGSRVVAGVNAWARARLVPDVETDLALERAGASEPSLAGLALSGRASEERLVRGLLSDDPSVRRVAGLLLTSVPLAVTVWPVPTAPFDRAGYLDALAQVGVGEPNAPSEVVWRALASVAANELAAGGARASHVLGAIVGGDGGLWPRAFVELTRCGDAAGARWLGGALRDSLRALVRDDAERAPQALALLVQSGAVDAPEVAAVVRDGDVQARAAVLDALAGLERAPAGLVPLLQVLLVSAPDWPTRMRAARALATEPGVRTRVDEPITLVRAALAAPRVRGGGRCVLPPRGLAN